MALITKPTHVLLTRSSFTPLHHTAFAGWQSVDYQTMNGVGEFVIVKVPRAEDPNNRGLRLSDMTQSKWKPFKRVYRIIKDHYDFDKLDIGRSYTFTEDVLQELEESLKED